MQWFSCPHPLGLAEYCLSFISLLQGHFLREAFPSPRLGLSPSRSPHFWFIAVLPATVCTRLSLYSIHKHHRLCEGSGRLFTAQLQHLAPCLHTEGTQEYRVSNEWKNGQIELGGHSAGGLPPCSFYLGQSGLPCQNQRAWVCWEPDVPFPVPGRGSRCFPKIHIVIVPAA